jgi:two-component system, cell cycle response regulator DivK
VKSRILVVEDNPLNSELLCDWLEAKAYEVHSVENIAAARVAIETKEPDVVLLDVQLGDEDGLALAEWMREQPSLRRVPVIAVTAHAMVTEQQRFLQAGCNACVSKPVNFQLLSEQLDYWLAPRLSITT